MTVRMMAMIVPNQTIVKNDYPTTDGKPMAETDFHRILMVALIQTLERWYALDPMVYVSGNLLLFYEEGNRRRHLSPDVFVVKGVPKRQRLNYLLWEEGRGPDMVIELTSSSTRHQDTKKKLLLYQNTLRVPEYFLFDPHGDYLDPVLQGYRLHEGRYVAIEAVDGRLPSDGLELHLEPRGTELRLYDPTTGFILLTREESETQEKERAEQAEARAEQAETRAEQEKQRARQERQRAEQEKQRAEQAEERVAETAAEMERLRRELEALSRPTGPDAGASQAEQ